MRKAEVLNRIELRQSTLKDYLHCPLMFRFRHIQKLDPVFRHPAALHGSTLHRLIWLLHREDWELDVTTRYVHIFEHLESGDPREAHIPVRWKQNREKELGSYVQNAVELLNGYRNSYHNQLATILFAESRFHVKLAGHWFSGTIDQVRKNPDGRIELIDFKSSAQRPSHVSVLNDWQLGLYTYALRYGELELDDIWVKPKLIADYSSLYMLRGHQLRKRNTTNGRQGDEMYAPLIRTSRFNSSEKGRIPADLKHFRQETTHLVQSLSWDWPFPNPSACSFCGYIDNCLARHDGLSQDQIGQARERLETLELL